MSRLIEATKKKPPRQLIIFIKGSLRVQSVEQQSYRYLIGFFLRFLIGLLTGFSKVYQVYNLNYKFYNFNFTPTVERWAERTPSAD